nr:hypothetical protein [uncultured Blautia sp.]
MKQIHSHSKNSLFLMEMIFALLFLALSSAACIRIFAAAAGNHVQAVENRQIQAHTVSVSEIMEGSDGSTDSFIQYLCGGTSDASSVSWYYDSDWNICEKQDASYQMRLELSSSRYEKTGILSFYRIDADNTLLHSTELRFPSVQPVLKEAES